MQIPPLGREESLEEGMATHSSIVAWRVLSAEKLAGYGHGVTESLTRLSD